MGLTKDRKLTLQGSPDQAIPTMLAIPVEAGAKLFSGGLVATNAAGNAVPASADTTLTVQGFCDKTVDNTAGNAGDLTVLVRRGSGSLDQSGTTIDKSSLKSPVYAVDDHTVSLSDGGATRPLAGFVESVLANGQINILVGVIVLPDSGDSALATPTANGLMSAAYASAVHQAVANMTALKAIPDANRADGMMVNVQTGTGGGVETWIFNATSTATDATESLVAQPAAGSGRWLFLGGTCTLTIPVTFATADNAVIYTVPVGARLHPRESWWDVGTSWTGGSSAAIGVHASVSGYSTKGDILGGAGGDVLATLVSTATRMTGTEGTKLATRTLGRLIMVAADTLNFDRIVDAFSAGAANVRVLCDVLKNVGA